MTDGIKFFGNIDRVHGDDRKGLSSGYPVTYFREQLDALATDIEDHEMRLREDRVPPADIYKSKADLKRKQEKMAEIKNSVPKITAKQKDELAKAYKDMSEKLMDAMPSYSDMQGGFANVHDEVRKMTKPCVSVGAAGQFLGDLGIKASGGKITRNEAARAFKIMGHMLGEQTNVEALRRDRNGGTYRNERYLHEMCA